MSHRLRFSLRAFFLLVLASCVAVGIAVVSRRLHHAEQELRTLRDEAGYLSIDDRTQLHAIAVETGEPHTWRWRLFVPKGHRYAWKIACEDIPKDEVPDTRYAGISNEPYWETDNEVLVTARLRQVDDAYWQLTVDSRIGNATNQMHGASLRIPSDKLHWMSEVPATDGRIIGKDGTTACDPAGPIILLQRRACERQPDGTYQPSQRAMPGFIVWLEQR